MKRYGQIIGVKPKHFEEYKKYLAAVWPDILKMITACNLSNYTIINTISCLPILNTLAMILQPTWQKWLPTQLLKNSGR